VAAGLFLGMLALHEIGRRLGLRRIERDPEGASAGAGVIDGAVFGLLGLLVAFTFSGAAARFDGRRHLVVEEANAIGTAWLRLDLLPALNEMIDITTTRTMAARMHPPNVIFALLIGLGLVCALFAGIAVAGGKQRPWVHAVGFSAVIAITVYVILDLEYPRLGLIRVDAADRVMLELRESMQ